MRTKLTKIALAALIFTSQIAFAKDLSKECINEFTSLPSKRSNFALDNFLKELPAEVLKTKAQMKLPFGKPKPSKITDIGISVGCLNAFPESTGELADMVQAIGVEIARIVMRDLNGLPSGKSSSSPEAKSSSSEAESSSSSETKKTRKEVESSSSSEAKPSSSSETKKTRKEAK